LACSSWAANPADETVLEFVRATRVQRGRVAYLVDVTISASLPALHKAGVLRAVKKQLPAGRAAYQTLLYNGDGLVKTNVIARYLSAELEAQMDPQMRNSADLVIEVMSPSSEVYDRSTKADTYLALGVRELWLISQAKETIEVRIPTGTTTCGKGQSLPSSVFPNLHLRIDSLFA